MFVSCCKSFSFDGLKLKDMYGVVDTIGFMICCLSNACSSNVMRFVNGCVAEKLLSGLKDKDTIVRWSAAKG